MGSLARRRRTLSGTVTRLIPFGSFAGLGALAVADTQFVLAGLLGIGAAATGRRFLDRRRNERRELRRRARDSMRELGRVAREDRVAAPQMKRLAALQEGLLESWELLPEEYGPLLAEDMFTIVGEVEDTALLARRRAALRRHLEGMDRRGLRRRVRGLEKDLAALGADSSLRAPFEDALAGRREELAGYDDILNGISVINAQLEAAESLLGNLRGELLALDTGLAPRSLDSSGLVHLKERVAYFRRSLDEMTRGPHAEELPAR